MQKIFLYLIIFAGITNIFAQSVHQIESEYYSKQSFEKNNLPQIEILNKLKKNDKLNKIVFGYLPYWEYLAGSHRNLRYDLLTHLALFSFEADSNGNLKDPLSWPWYDVINYAASNNVKLIATITNFNGDDIHSLLTDSTKRCNLFVNIKNKLQSTGLNGVNIDFENVKDIDKPSAISNFFLELRKYLSSINTPFEISFASPVVNYGNWNFSSIAQSCDYLFIMCYDFYGSWSTTTGPSSPCQYINNSFNKDYLDLVTSSPQKLVLGVPYYGNYWKTKLKDAYAPVDTNQAKREFVKTIRYKEIFPAYQSKEILWDNLSQTRWMRWQDASWNQIWYDDDSSLAVKYNLAIQKKLGGVGIWALGYDDGRQELWKLIEKKFTGTVAISDEKSIPNEFCLYQNYPNPFNPTTIITYKIPNFSRVTLKVYDLLGREMATIIDDFKQPGVYNLSFDTINYSLPSGVYIYTLQASNYFSSKKMLLLK